MPVNLTAKGIFFKAVFDGADLIQGRSGSTLIPDIYKKNLVLHTLVNELYINCNDFLKFCQNNFKQTSLQGYIKPELMEKYKVGSYTLKDAFNKDNPWYNNLYVLFNFIYLKEIQNQTGLSLDTTFWVCPSFSLEGECTNIGFRIVDLKDVEGAFKWLFMKGNNIIYGENTVDKTKPCYIVEGFRDYVALNESGINAIGLGSVEISEEQKQFIDTLYEPILLFDNDYYGLKQALAYRSKYRIATLQTIFKDAYETYINGEEIKILEIE